ncbi:MAG TPA: hypothetical protein VI670_07250, partial [Thermoanaerobaculia bacterium]
MIGVGASTTDTTIVFKAGVSDPDAGQQVKLEIELRRLAENGGGFTGVATQSSGLVSNGTTATITAGGLIPDTYHWRARTVDSSGAVSQWVSFGNNADSATDFQVVTNSAPNNPSSLNQYRTDGTTVIGVGASTTDTTIVFKAGVSDPDAG